MALLDKCRHAGQELPSALILQKTQHEVAHHRVSSQLIDELRVVVHNGSGQQVDPEERPNENKPHSVEPSCRIMIELWLPVNTCISIFLVRNNQWTSQNEGRQELWF